MLRIDEEVAAGSAEWCCLAAVAGAGRAADFLSTRLATPGLVAEANPLARWLGWRWGLALNFLVIVPVAGMWPLVAISLAASSAMVAARNLQNAWLIRSMGEHEHRFWMARRVEEAGWMLPLGCHWGEAVLVMTVGGSLMAGADLRLIPFAIGLGLTGYGAAILVFATLSLWRGRPGTR